MDRLPEENLDDEDELPVIGYQLLRRPAVEALTGLSRSEIYRLMAIGQFPKQYRLSRRKVVWRSDQLIAWVHRRCGDPSPGVATGWRQGRP